MKIGFDIDDVVVKFVEGYIEYYNRLKGTNFKYEDARVFDLWKIFGISRGEDMRHVEAYQSSAEFDSVGVVEGASDGIRRLSLQSHELFAISARPLRLREKTGEFFRRHFPESIIHFYFSGEIYSGQDVCKAEICLREGIEIMIEDSFATAQKCARRGIRALLMNKPWNESIKLSDGIKRVSGWQEVLEEVERMKKMGRGRWDS